MNLQQQIEALIAASPQDGQTPAAVAAIAPVLQQFAQQLKQNQYYIVESADQQWQVTTLRHREKPELEKTVIYAYRDPAEAAASSPPPLRVVSQGVIALLFQLIALEGVDSLIFMENSRQRSSGKEIRRQSLQEQVQRKLQECLPQLLGLPADLA